MNWQRITFQTQTNMSIRLRFTEACKRTDRQTDRRAINRNDMSVITYICYYYIHLQNHYLAFRIWNKYFVRNSTSSEFKFIWLFLYRHVTAKYSEDHVVSRYQGRFSIVFFQGSSNPNRKKLEAVFNSEEDSSVQQDCSRHENIWWTSLYAFRSMTSDSSPDVWHVFLTSYVIKF